MEKITVMNRRNQNLSALFHKPINPTKKIIIFAHSFKGDKDYQPIIRTFSEHICHEGYAVIRFDCWGSGESDGEFEDSSITTQFEDVQDIIKYVKSKGYLDICLLGLSLGTTNSIMAYENSIKCMILWSPVFQHQHFYDTNKNKILQNGFIVLKRNLTGEQVKCGKAMWQDFKDIKPYQKLSQIHCPVLAILGSKDDNITEKKAQEFMNMIPSENKLEIIHGGDHDFLVEEAKKKAIELSTNFIKAHL